MGPNCGKSLGIFQIERSLCEELLSILGTDLRKTVWNANRRNSRRSNEYYHRPMSNNPNVIWEWLHPIETCFQKEIYWHLSQTWPANVVRRRFKNKNTFEESNMM